ncbi:MAG TPA: TIGR04149 family rSAM-modified RiPP [Bacteroidales bacterium]
MKDLKSIKLTKLDRVRLEERKMSYLVGGDRMHYDNPATAGNCNCGCYYANSGGSSTESNDKTNKEGKLTSYSTPAEIPQIIRIKI